MAVKKRPEDPPPNRAYLVSFGDTMTTLLAFFIVLCSLAEEQTGADLYSGTGSFVKAIESAGLPGKLQSPTSSKVIDKPYTGPHYVAEDLEKREPDPRPSGPDEDNDLRSLDRELEGYQRFLGELGRLARLEELATKEGEVTLDFFNVLPANPPYLSPPYREAFQRILPALRREGHQLDVVVWAPSPRPTTWAKAARQAVGIVDEVTKMGRLSADQRSRVRSVGRSWLYRQAKRPVMSVIIRKVDNDLPTN
jgi:hypothetical protein